MGPGKGLDGTQDLKDPKKVIQVPRQGQPDGKDNAELEEKAGGDREHGRRSQGKDIPLVKPRLHQQKCPTSSIVSSFGTDGLQPFTGTSWSS